MNAAAQQHRAASSVVAAPRMAACGADPEKVQAPGFLRKSVPESFQAAEAKSLTSSALEESDELLMPSADGHHPFLDITRICCVGCVAIDHGNSAFGMWNVAFSQEWVLQYLYLVSGVCYGMSSRGLMQYEMRLAVYLLIGVLVNWSAWVVTGQDWMHDFFNVVFHLWFVAGLMIYAALLAPLRPYLEWVRRRSDRLRAEAAMDAAPSTSRDPEAEHPDVAGEAEASAQSPVGLRQRTNRDSLLRTLAVVGGGLVAMMLVFHVVLEPCLESTAPMVYRFWSQFGSNVGFWGLPNSIQESQEFLQHTCRYVLLTLSNVYLIIVCPLVLQQRTVTGWLVLANTYLNRMLFHRGQDERPFHGLDLMMITLTCQYLGLKGRRKVGEYVIRYWFVVLLLCTLLWPPGEFGRFDENPPTRMDTRIRINLLEAIFVVVWLVAGERLVQPEIFTEDGMDFLNSWALIVFLVHKAVHIMFVPPLNWGALLAIAPVCYLSRREQ